MNNERTYGIEIEAASRMSREDLAIEINEALGAEGLDHRAVVSGYHHNTDSANVSVWEIQYDMSIMPTRSYPHKVEIVSPVLKGKDGLRAIEIVCAAVQDILKVNRSCGLHVHHYIESAEKANAVAQVWLDVEAAVMNAMPPSRRVNRFCQYLRKSSGSRDAMIQHAYRDRYHTLNLSSYSLRNTIEFRCHSGTTEAAKIQNWILATQGIVEATVEGRRPTGRNIEDVQALIASARIGDSDYNENRGKKPSRAKTVQLLNELIETGSYTKKDILAEAERRGFKRGTMRFKISEALDIDWNPCRTEVKIDEAGRLYFADTSRDTDYATAAEWIGIRHAHFQAAA